MSDPMRVQMSGPLSVFAAGFLEELLGRGYRPGTAAKQLQLMAHLSRWMAERHLEPGALRAVQIERFVEDRRASGRVQLSSARALVPLLRYLRDMGAAPAAASRETRTPAGALVERYADYLLVQRRRPASRRGIRFRGRGPLCTDARRRGLIIDAPSRLAGGRR